MKKRQKLLLLSLVLGLLVAGGVVVGATSWGQELVLSHESVDRLADRVNAHPTDWRAQYWYGRRQVEAGNLREAEMALRVALGAHADYTPAWTKLGQVLLAENRIEEAFQVLRSATGRDPRNVEGRVALAALYRGQGAGHRAIDVANEALAVSPNDIAALYELGAAQAQLTQLDAAEATFRRASALAPQDVHVLVGLSRVFQQEHKSAEAEAAARAALQVDPLRVDAMVALASAVASQQPVAAHREEALKLLAHARELEPDRSDVTWNIAEILVDEGRWKDAIPELLTTVRQDPDKAQAYFFLARACRALGNSEQGARWETIFHRKEDYQRKIQTLASELGADPENAKIRFEMGELHARAGHLTQAITSYRSGLERDPENAEARRRLAQLVSQSVGK